ncbi:MAG: dienelactone hydrolase family protein [Myxococcales bacterium]|nr:dienelactone hydrolase family protein [Myxococcales bacterium]
MISAQGAEVALTVDGHAVPAYAVLPEGAAHGVVVVHEVFGRQPEIDRVCDRFARAGYAAVAPDLFAHGTQLGCIRRMMVAISTGEGLPVRQVLGARAWLCEQTGLSAARIGIIGFCMGGGFALAVGRGWGAVSANYGKTPPRAVLEGTGPVIACYGERDRLFAPEAKKLERELEELGVEHEVHLFPGAGHSFLTDGSHPVASFLSWPLMHVRYEPETAERAWEHILAFFDAHL